MDNRPKNIVPATREMALAMAGRLRPEHVREVREVSGLTPAAAVLLSLAASVEAYALVPPDAGTPVFMMGVGRRDPATDGAMVWMLGTENMSRHGAKVLAAAKWGVGRAFRATGATHLWQRLPAWYLTGMRFVLRLGFVPTPAAVAGPEGWRQWDVVLRRNSKGKEKPWVHCTRQTSQA